ncbi:MAG: hypothetical protein KDD62_03375 [Bdellovibrionales bacterium]|nr:hypothetical protein [Bdellovibrionales bacterium]
MTVPLILALWIVPHSFLCAEQTEPELAYAQDGLANSILMAVPSRLASFEKPYAELTSKQRVERKVFGLRMQSLHPAIWGVRFKDRTENRNLVAMRPYYLRISEHQNFYVSKISTSFKFDPIQLRRMKSDPTSSTPLLDIGIGGSYEGASSYELPEVDSEYVIRVSPSPHFKSGIYYRSFENYLHLVSFEKEIKPAEDYSLSIEVKGKRVTVSINGAQVATYLAPTNVDRGLIALRTAWHPLSFSQLSVEGSEERKGKWYPVKRSGMVLNG